MSKNLLYYWDTSIFLAWLKNEKRNPGEMEGLEELATQIHNNEARMITSVVTKSEILKSTLSNEAVHKLEGVLRRRNVQVIMTDDRIWDLTTELRDYYQQRKDQDKLPTLTTPDAVHLATAIIYKADTFYTFDEKDERSRRRALIPLSGQVAGKYNLVISKPMISQLNLHLPS